MHWPSVRLIDVIVENATRKHLIIYVDFLEEVLDDLTLFVLLHNCVVVLVELDLLHDNVLHARLARLLRLFLQLEL